MEELGPTGTTETLTETGATGTTETGPTGDIVVQPIVIRLNDILTREAATTQQQEDDKVKLNSLINPDLDDIRAKLIAWANRRFQLPCDLVIFTLTPPTPCTDGVNRNLFDYISFLTGKTLEEHMQALQVILPDFYVAYHQEGNTLKVGVVTR